MKPNNFYVPYIYFLRSTQRVIQIGKELPTRIVQLLLADKSGILIWENQGSFIVIPNSILHNLKTHYEIARSLNAMYPRMKSPKNLNTISWEQGHFISPAAAKVLLLTPNDNSDDLSNSDTPTDAAGKDQANKPQSNTG